LRGAVEGLSEEYIEDQTKSYRKVTQVKGGDVQHYSVAATAESSVDDKENETIHYLAHSTIYRWTTDIAASSDRVQPVVEKAMKQDECGCLCAIVISPLMYRSDDRKRVLMAACRVLRAIKLLSVKNHNRDETRGASP